MIELEKAPMPNPPIELEQDPWWWKVVGRKATGHRLTTMSDGGKVQYKYHIALDPATFLYLRKHLLNIRDGSETYVTDYRGNTLTLRGKAARWWDKLVLTKH